jgi:hypothetical protein
MVSMDNIINILEFCGASGWFVKFSLVCCLWPWFCAKMDAALIYFRTNNTDETLGMTLLGPSCLFFMNEIFRYLRLMLQNDGEIDEDVSHRIRVRWVKWRQTSGIFCNKKVPNKLKDKFYRTTIRLVMMYGAEYWATKGQHIQKMSVAEIQMLRWICGHIRKYRIRNDDIRNKLG